MANTKVTQHVIANNAITADQLASAAVTDAKLHSTLDLSGKTLTLPATAIPSASTATTQAASDNTTKLATTAYVTTAIANLNDSAPSALNTLNELAAALNDDANFSATITTALGTKLPLAGGTLTGALTLSGAPTNALHPATKAYTDTADALKLNLSGGTLTGDLILNTTTALKIPAGTTGQRPSAAVGQIRWNTTDGALEVYNGTAWTAVGTGSSNKVLDTFTGDNSNRTFTLSVTPANEDAIMVFIDGAYQEKGDYVLTNNSLVLDTAPLAAEKIAVHITTASVHDGTTAVNNQFTATAGQTAFTLTQDPLSENNTQVYINGVYQQKTDYTVVGTTLTFDTGLTVGDVVEVNMFTVATLGNTDTVTEGVSNLYHTTARARGAISVSGNAISYNSSTGVISSAYEETPTFTGTITAPTATFTRLEINATNIKIKGDLLANNDAAFDIGASGANRPRNLYLSNSITAADITTTGVGAFGTISSGNIISTGLIKTTSDLEIASSQPRLHLDRSDGSYSWNIYNGNGSGNFPNSTFNIANNAGTAVITALDNGNVGIGTTSPAAALEVARGSAGYVAMFGAPQGSGKVILFKDNHASPNKYNWLVGTQYNTNNAFEITPSTVVGGYTFNAPAITVLQTGNVGIGTASPDANSNLHIHSSGNTQLRLTTSSGANTPTSQIGYSAGSGYFLRLADGANNEDVMLRTYGDSVINGGAVTMSNQPGFFARGNTSQWMQGAASSWNTIVAGIAHANGSTIGVNLTEGNTGALNGYDAGSDFNTSNGRFTAPIAGKYLIHGSVYCAKVSNNGDDYMHFLVYVNGQQINQMYTIGGHKQAHQLDFSLNLSSVLRLDANDYVEWKLYTTSSSMRVYGDHLCIGAHMIS